MKYLSLVFAATILLFVFHAQTIAQDDVVKKLERRVAQLERETASLRQQLMALTFVSQAANGVEKQIQVDGKVAAKLIVARTGWGCSPNDVAAVLQSVAETILKPIRPHDAAVPTVMVMRSSEGPKTLTRPGPNGEYIVLINSGDRRWAQVGYQFAHEFGHVLCGDLSMTQSQRWFEESFCESLSLWALESMSVSWQTKPPYDNWKSYAPNLKSYSETAQNRVASPTSLREWFPKQANHLTGKPYDRDSNMVLAKEMAKLAHQNPDFLKAFYYLRNAKGGAMRTSTNQAGNDSMVTLLKSWYANCPEGLKPAPKQVGDLIGVKFR